MLECCIVVRTRGLEEHQARIDGRLVVAVGEKSVRAAQKPIEACWEVLPHLLLLNGQVDVRV